MPEKIDADVCVVGAGFAGLSAALALQQSGKTVMVLEARDRVGGRIWTQQLSDGSVIDRGGAWLAPRHDAVLGLARSMGVSTYKTWVKGAHLLVDGDRLLRYTGLIPKISPLAVVTIALAQARLDLTSRRVPIDAPWNAKRASRWDTLSVAWWLDRAGIRTAIARDLFDMAVRGLFTGDLNETSFLHLLFLVRAHGSINKLFSIEGGSQENMVEGGAGLIAQRIAASLGASVRMSAPVRSIAQHQDHVVVVTPDVSVSARHAVVSVPPVLALEIEFDPALPADRRALYSSAVAGPESKTLVVYQDPFWRSDGFSGQSAGPRSAAEVTLDASPISGKPGVIASFTFGAVAQDGDARRGRQAASCPRRADRQVRTTGRIAGRVHRDRMVDREVDAGVLDGALPPGDPDAIRAPVARTLRTGALGRNRNRDPVARRHRRGGPLRAASRSRDPGPRLGVLTAARPES